MKKAVRKKVVKKKAVRKWPRRRISAEQAYEIDRRFDFVSDLRSDQTETCIEVRKITKQLAKVIIRDTPACREQSLAITKLEEALHFAIAAIVRPNENS